MSVRAKLKIMQGSNAGRILEINVPQYVIGRAPGCSLRPQSDAISRQHCAILSSGETVTIRDLKSRNGTILNGEKIESEVALANGDELQVGPLLFQVILAVSAPTSAAVTAPIVPPTVAPTPAVPIAAVPEPSGPLETSTFSKAGPTSGDSGLISDWLLADDREIAPLVTSSKETRQFKMDETANVPLIAKNSEAEAKSKDEEKKKAKKEFGKLPKPAQDNAGSSRDAAAETLKKMYNRGL